MWRALNPAQLQPAPSPARGPGRPLTSRYLAPETSRCWGGAFLPHRPAGSLVEVCLLPAVVRSLPRAGVLTMAWGLPMAWAHGVKGLGSQPTSIRAVASPSRLLR